jgi:hypothetical protein
MVRQQSELNLYGLGTLKPNLFTENYSIFSKKVLTRIFPNHFWVFGRQVQNDSVRRYFFVRADSCNSKRREQSKVKNTYWCLRENFPVLCERCFFLSERRNSMLSEQLAMPRIQRSYEILTKSSCYRIHCNSFRKGSANP